MSIRSQFPNLTDYEVACKLLDEVICLLAASGDAPRERLGISVVKEALELIAKCSNENPDYAVTLWLADRMRERGLLKYL